MPHLRSNAFGVLRASSAALIGVGCLVAASFADAQDLSIVTANSSNNQLLLANFDGSPALTQLNADANVLKSLRSIAIRDDRADGVNLIVADSQAAEIRWYADPVVFPATAGRSQLIGSLTFGPGPASPVALALSPARDLFALSSGSGNAASKAPEVWLYRYDPACSGAGCRPGHYVDPVKLADALSINVTPGSSATLVHLDELEEARVAAVSSGRVVAGDLLILSSAPAALVRLPGVGSQPLAAPFPQPEVLIYPATATGVDARRTFPAGVEPGGFDFAPGGRLLVTTSTGSVLNYDTSGNRQVDGNGAWLDFASGLGNGKFKIGVAAQRGVYRAFVADRNGGELLRFDFAANGTGLLTGDIAAGIQFPVGVATTSGAVTRTPVGLGVKSSPTQVVETLFREVQVAGFTSGTVYIVPDPRTAATRTQPFLLSDVDASLPAIEVPGDAQGFGLGGPAGPPVFVAVIQKTSTVYAGSLAVRILPKPVLQWDPPCTAYDAQQQYVPLENRLRAYWGPIASEGERPILEGDTVLNLTSGCGSGREIVRESSIFLLARSLLDAHTQTRVALDGIAALLNDPRAAALDQKTRRELAKLSADAARNFSRGNYVATRDSLLALVRAATAVQDANRVGPELESRGSAAAFAVCSIEIPIGTAVCQLP